MAAAHLDRCRARACDLSCVDTCPRAAGAPNQDAANGEHGLVFQAEEQDVGALSLALAQAGIGILALTPELATLEDLFFRLTET